MLELRLHPAAELAGTLASTRRILNREGRGRAERAN